MAQTSEPGRIRQIIDVLAVGVALSRGPGLLAKLEKAKQSLRERRVPRQKAGAARSSGAPGAETGINQGSSQ